MRKYLTRKADMSEFYKNSMDIDIHAQIVGVHRYGSTMNGETIEVKFQRKVSLENYERVFIQQDITLTRNLAQDLVDVLTWALSARVLPDNEHNSIYDDDVQKLLNACSEHRERKADALSEALFDQALSEGISLS